METIGRTYARLLDLCGVVAGLLVGLLALFISVDIVIRNIGLGNFPWLLDASEYALYISTFLAAPWVLRLGAHVRVDLLMTAVGRGTAWGLELAADATGLCVSGVLFWYGLTAFLDAYHLGSMVMKEIVLPEWCLLLFIPVTAAMLVAEFVRRLRGAFRAPADQGPRMGFARERF